MQTDSIFRIAFWVLFGGMAVMQVYFASRVRQAGERVKADRQAIEREALKSRWASRKQEMHRAFDVIRREAATRQEAQREQSPADKVRQHDRREEFRAASEGRKRSRTRTRRRSPRDEGRSE